MEHAPPEPHVLQLPYLVQWAIDQGKVQFNSQNDHLASWVDALAMPENAQWAMKVLVKWKGEEKFNPEEFLSLQSVEEAAVFLLLTLMAELPQIAPHTIPA